MDYCTKDTVTSLKDLQEIACTFHTQAGSLHGFSFKGTLPHKDGLHITDYVALYDEFIGKYFRREC